jgi:hypothetical protein
MDTCTDNITTLTTLLASGLFIVSEMLPYMSKVKGNGIVQIISDSLLEYLKKTRVQQTPGEQV